MITSKCKSKPTSKEADVYFEQKGINLDPKCFHSRGFVRFSDLTNLLPLLVIQVGSQQHLIFFDWLL